MDIPMFVVLSVMFNGAASLNASSVDPGLAFNAAAHDVGHVYEMAGLTPPGVAQAKDMPQLMDAKRRELYRQLLPKVDDAELARILADPNLMLYTDAEMPKAYQFFGGMMPGVHSASYNISANGSEPYGNGNVEFPWGGPAGTHRATNVGEFRFLWLPRDAAGKIMPVVYYRKRGDDGANGYGWTFPVGTVVGEVLTMRAPNGRDYTFEIRTRRRQQGDWAVNAYRPFPTSQDLAARIRELRPEWRDQPKLTTLCAHLDESRKLPTARLVDHHPRRAFDQTMGVDALPPVEDDALVAQLLTETTFRSALGATWRFAPDGTRCVAPTTTAAFHVVPANYDAGFVDVDNASCTRCHETTNQTVRRFDGGRDWYGRVRGSDGIFSFHPFSLSSISHNGFGGAVSLRGELVSAGVLQPFDSKKHPNAVYNDVEHLVD